MKQTASKRQASASPVGSDMSGSKTEPRPDPTHSHLTVEASSCSPRCQTPTSKPEIPVQRLTDLENAQVADAELIYEASHRMNSRWPELERVRALVMGPDWRTR